MNRETFKIIVRGFFPNAVFAEWGEESHCDVDTGACYERCCCASLTPLRLGAGLPRDTIVCHSLNTASVGFSHIYADVHIDDEEDTEENLIKFLRKKARTMGVK